MKLSKEIFTRNPESVRFWTWWNSSPVKITVRRDHPLNLYRFSRTDEGYDEYGVTYELYGDMVRSSYFSGGRDCDGRLDTWGTSWTTYDDLKKGIIDPEYSEIVYPLWTEEERGQRDYAAEAAGY